MVCGDEGIAEVFKQCSDLFRRILIFQTRDGIVNIQGDQLNTSIFQFLIVDTVNVVLVNVRDVVFPKQTMQT